MKQAALYGLKRGWEMGLSAALAMLLVKPMVLLGMWLPEQWLLWTHGGGDMWFTY